MKIKLPCTIILRTCVYPMTLLFQTPHIPSTGYQIFMAKQLLNKVIMPPQRDMVQLWEHFQQPQGQLGELGCSTSPSTQSKELAHLTEKWLKLALILHPHST